MSYLINPCKGCWETHKNGDCNINTINSCVTETAAAFSGIPSNNFIRGTDANKNWSECMSKIMKSKGQDWCDFQISMAPVFANSHYFPQLLYDQKNPDDAYVSCIEKCKSDRHPKECMNRCKTDRLSVEYDNNSTEKYDYIPLQSVYNQYAQQPGSKRSDVIMYIFIPILLILLIIGVITKTG